MWTALAVAAVQRYIPERETTRTNEGLMRSFVTPTAIAIAALGALAATAGAQRADRVTVGTASAPRGQTATGVITVPAGSDAGYDIPVAVVNGARAGKTLALAAGSHGTEYASIVAL